MDSVKVKNFSKSKVFSFTTPYLINHQKESWKRFWEETLKELFKEFSPIRDYAGKEYELSFLDYKLSKPNYISELEAKSNDDSYEAPLKVKTKLVDLKTGKSKEQEVFLCDFPLITEKATFIINGVERVIVSQLVRSPGCFFVAEKYGNKNFFGVRIIPNRGAWLEFDTDSTGVIWVKIDRKRKVAATTLLKAFGYKTDEIKTLFKDVDTNKEIKFIEKTLEKDVAQNELEALVGIYHKLRPGELVTPDTAREFIENLFFNFSRYDLSKVGRWKIWLRLYPEKEVGKGKKIKIDPEDRILAKEDVIRSIKEIIKLNNTPYALPDEIDHLGNRRVKTISDLLENRLRIGLMRMERIIKDRMSTVDPQEITPSLLINPRTFAMVVKEFFTSSQLAQFMDSENPLAEVEHKRTLTSTGPGGLTRERAGFEVRDVQPSHYGRICPIQTPEGGNVGLVGHLATFAKINELGFLEAPYFKVEKGRVIDEVNYLSAYEEEKYIIAPAGVPLDDKMRIIPNRVEARVKGEPREIEKEKVDYIDVSSKLAISVSTSLIPFLQNDDANRALMGSNMQRQAVPLINPDVPLVGTGVERNVARDSGLVSIAGTEGKVVEIDSSRIKIKGRGGIEEHKLDNFIRTNQYTCLRQTPKVQKGQKVKKGEILTNGAAVVDGRLALGHNLLVAFMPWRGNNFEDAIILSERLVKEDKFTSIHIEDFTCDVRETKLGPEITTPDIPNIGEDRLKDLDEEGIIRIGAEVKPNDILVGKIAPKGETDLTPEERLLRAIFGEKAREIKDTSLLLPHGKRGRVIGIKVFSKETGHKLEPGTIKRIKIEIAQIRKIKAGDKLAGRHGNKGVISKILPEEEMPFLEDGTPVDVILNPISVASRMNLGQILETHLGYAAKKMNYIVISPALLGANEEDIKKELREAGLPEDGKVMLYDGKTGESFPEKITVGYMYIMKLIHMVEDKIHARSIGPYSLITQQPLGGKTQFGGQRFGEMEVWALEGHGAAHALQEMLTFKSDDVPGRSAVYEAILKGEPIKGPGMPASFNLLVNELKAMGFSVQIENKEANEEKD
jgi:DNA-directed RNA polymerase subunit beta